MPDQARQPFVKVPTEVVDDPELIPVDVLVYAAARAFDLDADGKCHPGTHTIARRIRLSESTVKRSYARLKERGHLRLERKGLPGRHGYFNITVFPGGTGVAGDPSCAEVGSLVPVTGVTGDQELGSLVRTGNRSQGVDHRIELPASRRARRTRTLSDAQRQAMRERKDRDAETKRELQTGRARSMLSESEQRMLRQNQSVAEYFRSKAREREAAE